MSLCPPSCLRQRGLELELSQRDSPPLPHARLPKERLVPGCSKPLPIPRKRHGSGIESDQRGGASHGFLICDAAGGLTLSRTLEVQEVREPTRQVFGAQRGDKTSEGAVVLFMLIWRNAGKEATGVGGETSERASQRKRSLSWSHRVGGLPGSRSQGGCSRQRALYRQSLGGMKEHQASQLSTRSSCKGRK